MISPRPTAVLPLALAASVLLLAGCTATTGDDAVPAATTTPSETAPAPTITAAGPTPLAIPPVGSDELSRVVFTDDGKGGVPESASTVFAAPKADQQYALEGTCRPEGPVVEVAYRVITTEDPAVELQSGTFRCDGTQVQNVSTLATSAPPQIVFTDTDGASQAYLRLVPFAG